MALVKDVTFRLRWRFPALVLLTAFCAVTGCGRWGKNL